MRLSEPANWKIAAVAASVSRSAGGVHDAMRRLYQTLHQDHQLRIEVLGLHDAHSEADAGAWSPLNPRVFDVKGPRAFGYAPGLLPALCQTSPDLVHAHGIWMYPSLAAAQWGRRAKKPYLITPHGMLDPWALKNSPFKKKIAGLLFENRNLRGAACIHTLCSAETRAIREFGLNNPVCQIPNGIDLAEQGPVPPPPWYRNAADGTKILLYLGRIHPKKGLRGLLTGWHMVKRVAPRDEKWRLAVIGWDQGGHQTELQRLAAELEIERDVLFLGPRFGEEKASAYRHADAFILPSFSEGLPMVVLEAWANGLPVIMTPFCNLPEGYEAGAALRVDPEPDDICRALGALFRMGDEERAAMGRQGVELVRRRFTWEAVAAQMQDVYEWLLAGGEPPDTVMMDR